MNTLEFLQRILPSQGFYCAFLQSKKHNEFFDTIESLQEYVLKQDTRGYNVYHAIATFADENKRTKANAAYCRVITLDIDAKGTEKCYDTVQEAAKELGRFVSKNSLPKPLVVYSGNGLHVYWVLDRDLQTTEWNSLNDALRIQATEFGLKLDTTPSKNGMSLVLRPVGTHNPKGGREVRVVADAPPTTVAAMTKLLVRGQAAEKVVQAKKQTVGKLLDSLAVVSDLPPADSRLVAMKCAQVRRMVDNRASLSEPEWYHLLGVAAYCEEPESVAQKWSQGYPDYDPAETLSKMYQWREKVTGPTTCLSMEAVYPGGCDGCPYKRIISTPCRLGTVVKEAPISSDAPEIVKKIVLPKPFKRTDTGIYVTINDVDTKICSFDIYPLGYGRDELLEYEVVRYHWNRPHQGWQELKFRQAYLTDSGLKEFVTAIADQGIVLKNKTQTGYFQLMLRSYMDELRKMKGMSNLYATMGWKEDFTQFLIGNTLITKDGEEEIALASIGEHTTSMYTKKGTLEASVKFTSLVDKIDAPWIGNGLLFALSTPLFEFTGLRGMTLSLYGQTGSGKTITQLWQQSLFGDPDKLHGTAKFTQNALFSRMATVRNLPVTVDEATLMQDKDIGEFIMWTTQGRDKARLDRHAVAKEVREWFTTVTVSTNRSMTSLLLDGNMESNAQLARILEFQVHKHPVFDRSSEGGKKIYEFVSNNYGHIGRAYIQKLVSMGEEGIRATIEEAKIQFTKEFKSQIKFSGDERFWENALILMYVAGIMCTQENLIQFNYKRAIEWQLKQMNIIRREIKTIKKDSMDYLSEYLNEFSNSAVTVWYNKANKFDPVVEVPTSVYRSGVFVRFELFKANPNTPPDSGVVIFDKAHFRRWITSKSGDYREFVHDMNIMGLLAFDEGKRTYLTRNTPIRTGQVRAIGLNLSTPELRALIRNIEPETNLKDVSATSVAK